MADGTQELPAARPRPKPNVGTPALGQAGSEPGSPLTGPDDRNRPS